jgi:hypothetical protein
MSNFDKFLQGEAACPADPVLMFHIDNKYWATQPCNTVQAISLPIGTF